MDVLLNFISEDLIYALGWTVMHSLWQGFLIAIIMAFAFQISRKKSAKVRYEIATLSLFMVLVSAVCTFIWYFGTAGEVIEQQVTLVGQSITVDQVAGSSTIQNFTQSCIAYFNDHLPIIVLLWMIGASFFIIRLFGGLIYIQRLKNHRLTLLPEYWQTKVQVLISKIPTKKVVQIFESASVKVPMVIGYFKPYILLPIGAINQLDENEVEAIIAHELAHVFRNDFLLNILLSFIEVFFYYHPAVWWISGNIRLERENCCDDIAISVCGNSLTYAKALVRLQELNAYTPTFAMPFSGQKNQLLNRIRRILNQPQSRSNIMERLAATCFLLLAIIFISASPNNLNTQKENIFEIERDRGFETVETFLDFESYKTIDTIPKEKKILKGKELELIRKNGEISEVILDGRRIPKEEYETYDHIETEGKIIVKEDDFPNPSSDGLISPASGGLANPDSSKRLVFPDIKKKILVKDLPRLSSKNRQQSVIKQKNEDGQTVIIVETIGQEPVEIVVNQEEDVIIVEGNELQDGDTAVIIEEFPFRAKQFKLRASASDNEFFDKTLLKDKDKMIFYFNDGNLLTADTVYLKDNEMPRAEWIAKSKSDHQKRKQLITELAATEKKYHGNRKLKEEEREHLLALENSNHKSLLENEIRFKAKQEELADIRLKSREEHRQLFNTLEQEKRGLFNKAPSQNAQKIAAALKSDGLIDDEADFSFSLSDKRLKVNNKKQPEAIFEKYKNLYEKLTGNKLGKKSKYQINFSKTD